MALFARLKNDIPENKKGPPQDEIFHFVNHWCAVWEFPRSRCSLVIVRSLAFSSSPRPFDYWGFADLISGLLAGIWSYWSVSLGFIPNNKNSLLFCVSAWLMSRGGGAAGRPREQVQRNEKTVLQSSLENDLRRACGVWRTSGLQLDSFKLSARAQHIFSFNCLLKNKNANQIVWKKNNSSRGSGSISILCHAGL